MDAEEVVNRVRIEILKHIDSLGDRQVKERAQDALTKLNKLSQSVVSDDVQVIEQPYHNVIEESKGD